jgi:starch-binding outer membrane protein, SusD/RagB family
MIAGVLVFTSCEKIIEKLPETQLAEEIALTTTNGVQAAIIGCYNKMQSGDMYGGNIWCGGEMLANNVKKSGEGNIVFEETQLLEKSMSDENRIATSLWSNAYSLIHLANSILVAIPKVDEPEMAAEEERMRGEVLFIRGMIYFDMIRYYQNTELNLAVPLLTTPLTIFDQPARASIEDCYAQVISDLNEAYLLLPESNSDRATKWAAMALLSRVNFYYGDYQAAADAATEIIDLEKFSLVDSMPLNYSDALSSEVIFAMMSTQIDVSCGTLNGYFRQAQGAKFSPANIINKVFAGTGGLTDKRYTQLFQVIDNKLFCAKYDNRYMNVPLIRLAELYLTRAECIMKGASIAGVSALDDVNKIRVRAGIEPYEASQLSLLLVYYERFKELALEGDNFFNQKRLERDEVSDYDLPWNDRRLMYLIPKSELDVNSNLVQN